MEEQIRLQKFLADNGIASRRKCEELILQGKVRVNGEQINTLGMKINPNKDIVEYNRKEIKNSKKEYTYILLNKPIDYVTTVKDQFNRKTVLDLVKTNKRLVPVGRLDMYTSGAIILTDDGDFIYKVTHPKHEIEKTYNVTVVGIVTKEDVKKLENGVDIGHFITNKAHVKILKTDEEKNISRLQITIHEGKNRQIRRMCESIGKKVLSLHRARIGNISVKDLKLGTWRYLRKSEIDNLLK
jgi:23S rRNA pseudouridine2605 synthase